jgi:hypothetical protein
MRRRPKKRITIDDVRFVFNADVALADDIDEIDVEYTGVMCNHLMGCSDLAHGSLTLQHLQGVLTSESSSFSRNNRYQGATLTNQLVGEGNMIQYTTEEDGKIYVRARKNPANRDEWTLKRA